VRLLHIIIFCCSLEFVSVANIYSLTDRTMKAVATFTTKLVALVSGMTVSSSDDISSADQGCQIILCTMYQNGRKYTKCLQNKTVDCTRYQLAVKYANMG
jgi:hypothetical protein